MNMSMAIEKDMLMAMLHEASATMAIWEYGEAWMKAQYMAMTEEEQMMYAEKMGDDKHGGKESTRRVTTPMRPPRATPAPRMRRPRAATSRTPTPSLMRTISTSSDPSSARAPSTSDHSQRYALSNSQFNC